MWVDEIYTDTGHRGRGVAKWMVWRVAKRQRVELQVKTGDDGREARRAYIGMGMHALRGKERCRTYASVSNPDEYEFWVTDEYVVTSGWDRRTAVGVTIGSWAEVRDKYGEDIVELLVGTHGYTVGEARRNVEGEEGESKILVIEHGEEEAGGGMGAVERTHPTPHTHLTTHTHGRSGRGGRAADGGRGRGLGSMLEGGRVRRVRRDTTSRYGPGTLAEMEVALREDRGMAEDAVT